MKDKKIIVEIILENLKAQLQNVRDLKAISKSSTKERLTKLEKHVGLSTQLTKELLEKL